MGPDCTPARRLQATDNGANARPTTAQKLADYLKQSEPVSEPLVGGEVFDLRIVEAGSRQKDEEFVRVSRQFL
jgi:hypothetical protein